MSFSTKVKREIVKHNNTARHCQIAELLAIVLAIGEVELANDQVKLVLRLENELITDKISCLLDQLFGKDICFQQNAKQVEISNETMVDRLLQTIKLSDYVDYLEEDWLDEEELLDIEEDYITYVSSRGVSLQNCQFPRQVIQKDCCKKAFIRGMFLATGSVNDPNKAYHFEIV